MSIDCVNGRIHDDNGYDRGICGICKGSGCAESKSGLSRCTTHHYACDCREREFEHLRERLALASDLEAVLAHAIELGHLGEGSTKAWAVKAIQAWRAFVEGEK